MFKLLLIPSSDDERSVEDAKSLAEAIEVAKQSGAHYVELSFDTEQERDACIKGYQAGIGYLGGGLFFVG